MFEVVENKKISQIVIEQIQNMIMDGELKHGDKLPPERDLTEMMNIGRPALREGLKALEVLGLIERRHGQGNYIVDNVEDNFFKPLSLSFKLSGGSVKEILEMRYLIESFTAANAARQAAPGQVEELYQILDQMKMVETESEKSVCDKELHFAIARICSNSLIMNMLENASYLYDRFMDQTVHASFFGEDSIDRIYAEHQMIVDAIAAHDQEKATEAMNKHLSQINLNLIHEL